MSAGSIPTAVALFVAAALGGGDKPATVPPTASTAASTSANTGPANHAPGAPVKKATSEASTPSKAHTALIATAAAVAGAGAHEGGQFTKSESGKLDFHARDIDVAEAFGQLRRLLHKNIVVAADVKQHFSGDLYDVTLEEAVQAICRTTGLTAREEGNFLYIGTTEMQTRIFHLNYIRAEDLAPLVQSALSPEGKLVSTITAETGILPSQERAGGNTFSSQDAITIMDFPRNLEAAGELIRSFDMRPRQILIEATIMAATLTNELEFGVEVTALHDIPLTNATANFVTQTVNVGSLTLDQTKGGSGSAQTDLLRGISGEGLKFGFFNGGVGAFLRALQSKTQVEILATPRVITLNKQRGEVLLGRRDGYLTSTTTQTSTTQTVQFLETGTRLVYRPFIAADGYIRLEIHPEDSNGGLNALGLPYKDTAEITTNVLVKDNDTLVIGGLFRSRHTTVDKQVPWLGDIPYLGELFKSRDHITVREEIVVLLTPHILDGDAGVAAKAEAGAKITRVDRPRDAERLAQSYLEAARNRLESKDPTSAMLLIDAASAFDPRDPAIEILRKDAGRALISGTGADAADDMIITKVLLDAAAGRIAERAGQSPRPGK